MHFLSPHFRIPNSLDQPLFFLKKIWCKVNRLSRINNIFASVFADFLRLKCTKCNILFLLAFFTNPFMFTFMYTTVHKTDTDLWSEIEYLLLLRVLKLKFQSPKMFYCWSEGICKNNGEEIAPWNWRRSYQLVWFNYESAESRSSIKRAKSAWQNQEYSRCPFLACISNLHGNTCEYSILYFLVTLPISFLCILYFYI